MYIDNHLVDPILPDIEPTGTLGRDSVIHTYQINGGYQRIRIAHITFMSRETAPRIRTPTPICPQREIKGENENSEKYQID